MDDSSVSASSCSVRLRSAISSSITAVSAVVQNSRAPPLSIPSPIRFASMLRHSVSGGLSTPEMVTVCAVSRMPSPCESSAAALTGTRSLTSCAAHPHSRNAHRTADSPRLMTFLRAGSFRRGIGAPASSQTTGTAGAHPVRCAFPGRAGWSDTECPWTARRTDESG